MKNAWLTALFVSAGLCSVPAARAQTAPSPDPAAAEDEENLFRFYGTFNARIVVSTGAVESFSQPNAVAITAAGNPVFSNAPDRARYTFQVAQSRAGFWLNEQGRVRAQLEIDFVDFTKATPTVASLPRLRIARVDYVFHPGHTLSLGQDWDLHAPLTPHGINMVGALFQSGNLGFMRQQLRYLYASSELELGAALGFPAPNVLAKDAAFELGLTPTLAVRGAYKFGKSRVGASAFFTRLPLNLGLADERFRNALSVSLYSELAPSAETQVRVELNAGQNTSNLGMLSLGFGRADADLREAGGFVSVRQVLGGPHALYGLAGYQTLLQPEKAAPSYGYASAPTGGELPAFSSATLSGTGPGLLHNGTVRLGYELRPMPKLAFVLEGFLVRSHFRLQDVDVERTSAVRTSLGVETGALLSF